MVQSSLELDYRAAYYYCRLMANYWLEMLVCVEWLS